MSKIAIITGANGGMGREITKAVAKAGYTVVMACLPSKQAQQIRFEIMMDEKAVIDLFDLDLAAPETIFTFVETVIEKYPKIDLLINNAGVLYPKKKEVDGKWDYTTMVNYVGHYILTTKLLPFLNEGARIVNIISLTYRYGKIYPQMFACGRNSWVQQVMNYSNAKLALLYFTLDLAEQLAERNITANCSDPGIVGTKIIAMNSHFFDKICDVFARPFMKSPKNGAKTAIYLALNEKVQHISGGFFKNEKQIQILQRVLQSNEREMIRKFTQELLQERNITL